MNINTDLVIRGILNGREAYVGPEIVHIDLTNHCNNNCIGCWCRSPLLKDKEMPDEEKKLSLPYELIRNFLNDLKVLNGTRQIKLVGGGEPFMHPKILDIIEDIKKSQIEVDINTNFTLVSEDIARRLVELEVDLLTVSLWAGTEKAYVDTHPNKDNATFLKIREMLKLISVLKRERNVKKPWIRIYNVISNRNYYDVKDMLDFAIGVVAEDIQFVLLDPIKDRTDCLLINEKEGKFLEAFFNKLEKNYDYEKSLYIDPEAKGSISITAFSDFRRRLSDTSSKRGIYDEARILNIPCYVGWLFVRVMTTGNVVPCCKGHRMTLGNLYKDSFIDIWNSGKYREFRHNAKNLKKTQPFFSQIGNNASEKTGCYNCDNLWQNEPMHRLILTKGKNIKNRLIGFLNRLGNPFNL